MPDREILDADPSRYLIVNDPIKNRCRDGERYDGYGLHVVVVFGERSRSATAAGEPSLDETGEHRIFWNR